MAGENAQGQEEEPLSLGGVLEGRSEAIDAWFRSEHPCVYRLCVGLLANAAEADDLAQDAMLHLLKNLPSFDRTRSYRGWRTTIVINLCRDRMRRLAARSRAETAARGERLPPVLPDPSSAVQARDVRDVLERALAHLPEREREAFVLRDLEGTPTAEVASQLGLEESSVRSLLALARRRLRSLLAPRIAELTGAEPSTGWLDGGRG
jgi:RNA polymerase sigma-70 factor (ECF subfamily)